MAELISDFLTLPDRSALGRFIVKDGSDPDELARTYVFTRNVTDELDKFLSRVGVLLEKRQNWQSLGSWVYGSFGSGKSHFLRIVEMLLSRDKRLYAENKEPALLELQGKHRFLVESKILTVRVTMMGRDSSEGLTVALARAFDDRLTELGQPRANVFDHEALFAAFDAYCARSTTILDEFLDAHDYTRTSFATMRAGEFAQRRSLAQECAAFMYGQNQARFEPSPPEARTQMAHHASALGFTAVAFLIDEFVLWAQSQSGEQYLVAVNELTGLVDGERQPIPFIVLPAIQRSITERFQDDRSEDALRKQLSHTQERFRPQIVLEDKEIFEVAQRRVLAVRPERKAQWDGAVSEIVRSMEATKAVFVGNDAPETLRQLYPFHPALMHVLSDVSQGLQRERTSLFMLFQLLVEIRPKLEIGQFVSLGALWEALYSNENVVLLRQQELLRGTSDASHKLVKTLETYERLHESIEEAGKTLDERRILRLLVKSILLCQLSLTRFFGDDRPLADSITIENLFRLNRAEVDVPIEALGARTATDLLSRLAEIAPSFLKLSGKTPRDRASIALDSVDIAGMVDGLRPTTSDRFSVLAKYTKSILDVSTQLRDDHLDGAYPVTWRGTTRKGRVRFERLDVLAGRGHDNDFAPEAGEPFRILVLLDVNDPTAAVARIATARNYAQQWTAVIVPGVLSTAGRDALEALTRLEVVFERDKQQALGTFKMSLHATVERQVAANRLVAEGRLRDELTLAYARDSQILTLRTNTPDLFVGTQRDPGRIVSQSALQLLDLRYGQHPKFLETPRKSNLDVVLSVVARAAAAGGRTSLESSESATIERLGVPLELFDHGQLVASINGTGLYVSEVRRAIEDGETTIPLLRKRLEAAFGVQTEVADTVIAAFAMISDYRIADGTATRVVTSLASIDPRGRLIRGIMPDQATWIAGRSTAIALFGLRDVPMGLTAGNVEALVAAFRTRLAPALEAVSRARDAFAPLQVKGLFANSSVAFKDYRDAATSLGAFPTGEPLIAALAAIDADARNHLRAVIEAAGADADACAALLKYPLIDSVPPDLADELQRVLESLKPPIHPALAAWTTKASEWIRILARRKSGTNGEGTGGAAGNGSGPGGSTSGPTGTGARPALGALTGTASGTGQKQSATLPSLVVRDAASLDATLEDLRRLATAHFAEDGRSIAIDVRFVDPAVTDRA